ncbi:hypothetical protein B0I35DRAFT_99114 [Stachybotrys elegans]|uniref:Uncharacterized protein n=1 Tax=Stachybotrys elegans TaxID=80388 RepID=A0A8K0SI02_9HYPO|nr:hypothetical protein B0I35DRAFT_99114 [Stachybotrys elegans]
MATMNKDQEPLVCRICRLDIAPDEIISHVITPCQEQSRQLGFTCQCHRECHKFCEDLISCQPSLDCILVTSYKHPITPDEKHRRDQWLESKVVDGLSRYYGQRNLHLSNELWSIIASDLLHCYATTSFLTAWRGVEKYEVNLNDNVWCTFVTFEGRRYLSSLSNSPSNGSQLLGPLGETEDVCYAVNYLGITEVRPLTSPPPPRTAVPGIWWRRVRGGGIAIVESDGIKLRRIHTPRMPSSTWSVLPLNAPRFEHFNRIPTRKRIPDRMACLVFNDPSITAYSILRDHGIRAIHAHTAQDDDLSFYKPWQRGSWIYVPLEKGEVVRELWQRYSGTPSRHGLLMVTNMQRTFVAGTCSSASHPGSMRWTLVEIFESTQRVYLEARDNHIIGVLGFESPCPDPITRDFTELEPPPNPFHPSLLDYFSTKHNLENLREIIPCQKGDTISGILLGYLDGHQECAGEVRLDSLCEALQPDEDGRWSLVFKTGGNLFPLVSTVQSGHRAAGDEWELVMSMACRGTLFWVWSEQACFIIYEGQNNRWR